MGSALTLVTTWEETLTEAYCLAFGIYFPNSARSSSPKNAAAFPLGEIASACRVRSDQPAMEADPMTVLAPMPIDLTHHAYRRTRQRGVPRRVLDLVLDHADVAIYAGNGCEHIRLSRR